VTAARGTLGAADCRPTSNIFMAFTATPKQAFRGFGRSACGESYQSSQFGRGLASSLATLCSPVAWRLRRATPWTLVVLLAAESIPASGQPLVQGLAGDAKQSCGDALIAVGPAQGLCDQRFLCFIEGWQLGRK
jgi:hypothetical protein